MNAGRIKLLADEPASRYAELGIPTGELYRGIAASNYWKAKGELHGAIDDLEARIKDAFFDGYDARKYYYEDETTNVLEEWNRYNEIYG